MSDIRLIRRERDFVDVSGPEARSFLQGQLSQDIENLNQDSAAWSFLLDPSGLVVAWLRVMCLEEERFLLDMDSGFAKEVIDRLNRFLIRTKCTIEASPFNMYTFLGSENPAPEELKNLKSIPFEWPSLKATDYFSFTELKISESEPSGTWDQVRIPAGIPAMGSEITNKTIPAATGLVERSVSFEKGCYTGQELVARVDSRVAGPPKHLVLLKGSRDPLTPGSVLSHEGKEVLEITSASEMEDEFCALGYRHRSAEGVTQIHQNGSLIQIIRI
ncbi:MAG TPA: hypothetical protein QF762_02770 [Acidimicrobiales bacterium]|nr:hypothetical protein [Acidimicrobiales bacterium]|tara:strand:+ start:6360 stop:7181 length:822 start_codon:yes stop_codon:yes gene_type:complete